MEDKISDYTSRGKTNQRNNDRKQMLPPHGVVFMRGVHTNIPFVVFTTLGLTMLQNLRLHELCSVC